MKSMTTVSKLWRVMSLTSTTVQLTRTSKKRRLVSLLITNVISLSQCTQPCLIIANILSFPAEQDDQYNWYTYDLKEADDIDEVCDTINQLEGEYSYVYDEEGSGTWYKRNKKGQIISEDEGGLTMPELTPAVIGVIVAVCLIVIGGAAFLLKPKKKKNSDSSEPVYQGGTML